MRWEGRIEGREGREGRGGRAGGKGGEGGMEGTWYIADHTMTLSSKT